MTAGPTVPSAAATGQARLGFLGVGWIGRHRLEALLASGAARVIGVADPAAERAAEAADRAGGAHIAGSLEELMRLEPDGIVIATPSALHAQQAEAVLRRGIAVFCQKPLGRTAPETRRVVEAARAARRLLGVDLSYRHTTGMRRIRELAAAGELGHVYAADLVFHNAYGPDKPWFYDPRLAGGGCVIDLGIHLVDLALWVLDFPRVMRVTSRLFARGQSLDSAGGVVEDYAEARLDLETGATVRLACSWHLPAGCDAVITASFYGTRGGATWRNVSGSFFDFVAERHRGTQRECLASPPDAWGGRAIVAWAERLATGGRYDPEIERLVEVAAVLDAIYGRE